MQVVPAARAMRLIWISQDDWEAAYCKPPSLEDLPAVHVENIYKNKLINPLLPVVHCFQRDLFLYINISKNPCAGLGVNSEWNFIVRTRYSPKYCFYKSFIHKGEKNEDVSNRRKLPVHSLLCYRFGWCHDGISGYESDHG